jgi:ABC-2 type transport system ATP-binding protein
MSLIDVQHLSKSFRQLQKGAGLRGTLQSLFKRTYKEVEAVRDLSFTIEEGEIVGFLGPNGAGKTTTLKILSGVMWPSSGQATVLGYTPWKRESDFQRKFSIVLGGKNQLWWDLPAKETFLLNKEVYDIPDHAFAERVEELSHLLEVEHLLDAPVRTLSLGERMKCELINALLHEPRVLFLDEPTIGLDVVSQKAVRDFLRAWNKRSKTTILLTSHTMADVQALCDRVILIDHGKLFYDGALEELNHVVEKHKLIRVRFSQRIPKKRLESLGTINSFTDTGVVLEVPQEGVLGTTKQLLSDFPVTDFSVEAMPLEEVIRTIFLQQRQH